MEDEGGESRANVSTTVRGMTNTADEIREKKDHKIHRLELDIKGLQRDVAACRDEKLMKDSVEVTNLQKQLRLRSRP